MRPSKASGKSGTGSNEEGSASLEFLTVGLILLVPLVYLVLAMASIQGAALAAEGAARQAARVFVQAPSEQDARLGAARAVEFALADHGLEPEVASIAVTCAPRAGSCLEPGGLVTVAVLVSVPLPLLPPALGDGLPLTVSLDGRATQQVSRFWGSG